MHMKTAKIALVVLICLAGLGGFYLGFVFLTASGFIFAGDIDLTDEQRKSAETKVVFGSIFGLLLMLLSMIAMFCSKFLSERILKLFSGKSID